MDNANPNNKFFYTNTSKMAASPYDVTILFERSSPPTIPSTPLANKEYIPVVSDVLEVSMSPAHAKAVVIGLLNTLSVYEKTFGKIAMEPQKDQEFKSIIATLSKSE